MTERHYRSPRDLIPILDSPQLTAVHGHLRGLFLDWAWDDLVGALGAAERADDDTSWSAVDTTVDAYLTRVRDAEADGWYVDTDHATGQHTLGPL